MNAILCLLLLIYCAVDILRNVDLLTISDHFSGSIIFCSICFEWKYFVFHPTIFLHKYFNYDIA